MILLKNKDQTVYKTHEKYLFLFFLGTPKFTTSQMYKQPPHVHRPSIGSCPKFVHA